MTKYSFYPHNPQSGHFSTSNIRYSAVTWLDYHQHLFTKWQEWTTVKSMAGSFHLKQQMDMTPSQERRHKIITGKMNLSSDF